MILEEAPLDAIMDELAKGMQERRAHLTEDGTPCTQVGCDRRYKRTHGDTFRQIGLVEYLADRIRHEAYEGLRSLSDNER